LSNPYTTIINEIIKALLPSINARIGEDLRGAGFDPLKNVASGSQGFGIGTAHYSVTNLTGFSSVQIKDLLASNITGDKTLTGDLAVHIEVERSLHADIEGDVQILFADPSIYGNITIDGASIAAKGTFKASVDGEKLCINKVTLTSSDFTYVSGDANVDGPSILNDILKPLENLIMDAVKGDIRSLASSRIQAIFNDQINQYLPVCQSMS